jgi:hypothetical protein
MFLMPGIEGDGHVWEECLYPMSGGQR